MDSAGAFVVSAVGAPNVERTVSQEELERIKAFTLPNAVSPGYTSTTRNPLTDNTIAKANRWMHNISGLLDVYRTPEQLQKFHKTSIHVTDFMLQVFADCGEEEAFWMAKYCICLQVFDDRLDDPTNFYSVEKSMSMFLELNVMVMWSFPDDDELYKKFVQLLDESEVTDRDKAQAFHYLQVKLDEARLRPGTIYDTSSPEAHPLCKAFHDIWTPFCETMPADFLRRWALLFQNQLLGHVREIRARKYNSSPSIEEYFPCRRETVSTATILAAVEFLDKVHTPDEIFYCPEMQRWLTATLDFLICINDLWSFKKEAMVGDNHNLVIIVSKGQDCSYTEAGKKISKMILDKLAEMDKALSDLEKVTPPQYQHAVSRYSLMVRNLVVGVKHWHEESPRYNTQ
ncbi:unnamed protein product [Calypogeia fissa]